jgi:hypothetical protein
MFFFDSIHRSIHLPSILVLVYYFIASNTNFAPNCGMCPFAIVYLDHPFYALRWQFTVRD